MSVWIVAAAVSFIIKTKEEEAPVLKKATALQYETSDDDDDDSDDNDGKILSYLLTFLSTANVYWMHCFSMNVML